MKTVASVLVLASSLCLSGYAADEYTTSAAKAEDLESLYTAAIERRAADILDALDLKDATKVAEVHDAIVNQYRALRARDAVIDDCLVAEGQEVTDQNPKRQEMVTRITKPLHEWYITTLSAYLTPEQVEIVKDKMTYNKVKVTFDAYCEIIPNLTDSEKAMILEKLKAAREEAIDGGSADEKHAIFEQYKKQINAKLTADGHDVEKAFKDYEAKQGLAGGSGGAASGATN